LRVFKTKWFTRYARRAGIDDSTLCEAVSRAERGLIDADLGGNIIKQRIGKDGQSRSKGYRVLLAYRTQTRTFFLYGFAKNERDNVDNDELESLKEIGTSWLNMSDQDLKRSLSSGLLQEVNYGQKKI
jgi:hypothetical protein